MFSKSQWIQNCSGGIVCNLRLPSPPLAWIWRLALSPSTTLRTGLPKGSRPSKIGSTESHFGGGIRAVIRHCPIALAVLAWLLSGTGCLPAPTAAPTATIPPFPSPTPKTGLRRITLALGGDVMLGRLVNSAILQQGPRYPWGDVLPLVQEADLALVNLECTIAESGEPFVPPRVFYFRAHPKAIEVLTLAGVDYVTLANNHALDFQAPALLETIRHLDEHGIAHAGTGANLAEASQPAMLEAGGIKMGVVAFADHFREYQAAEDTPGTRVIPISTEEQHFGQVRESIQAAREAGADLVVFSIHWGPNMRQSPSPEFVAFAHAVMDAGADIFHGHSAHLFQGFEIYNGKPILYDTGDLIDDYHVDPQLRNDQQLLFLLTATSQGVERIELIPLLISYMQVNRATGDAFDEIAERICALSAEMGTEIEQEGERLVIDVVTYH